MEVLQPQTENFKTADSSDDEEIIISTRKKKVFNNSILSDDDDDNENKNDVPAVNKEDSIRDKVPENLNQDTDDEKSEDEIIKVKQRQKKKSRISIDDDSDDSDNEPDLKENQMQHEPGFDASEKHVDKFNNVDGEVNEEDFNGDSNNASSEADTSDEDSDEDDGPPIRIFRSTNPQTHTTGMRGMEHNDDLYDNEVAEDDLPPVDPSEIAEPSSSSRPRKSKDIMLELKSETQRLMRETPLTLPYHLPDEEKLTQLLRKPFLKYKSESPDKNKLTNTQSENCNENTGINEINELNEVEKKTASPTKDINNPEVIGTPQSNVIRTTQTSSATRTHKLLQKFGIALPDLSSTQSSSPLVKESGFLDLDDDTEPSDKTPKNTGVASLMQRFLKQTSSKKNLPKPKNKVEIKIIRKEKREDGTGVELVPDTVIADADGDKDNLTELSKQNLTPGEKLLMLRKQLAVKMRKKRDIERKKREEIYKLDNEEMCSGKESEEEEDEFEFSDAEESDIEEGVVAGTPPESEHEQTAEDLDGTFRVNGVIDDSDESECEDTQPVDEDDKTDSANMSKVSLRSGISEAETTSMPRFQSDNSVLLFDDSTRSSTVSGNKLAPLDRTCSDDSFYASLIPGHQPETSNLSTSFSKPPTLKENDSGEFGDCDFEPSQPFHFEFDASQSQLLDADGMLRESGSQLKAKLPTNDSFANLPLEDQDDNANDGNMSELLDLCSGQFQNKKEQPLSEIQELLALCSGKFSDNKLMQSSNEQKQDDRPISPDADTADTSFGFKVESEPSEGPIVKSNFDSDADNESDNDEKPIMIVRKRRHKARCRDRARLDQFTEKEAELSGSDVGSGDEEEGDSDDEYEEDIITEELPTDEVMKQQVGKLHMRQVMNEEEEEIELLKEAFASARPEFNRDRKFKWKNIDSDITQNLFKCDSSDNDEDTEDIAMDTQPNDIVEDSQWRRDRLEREEFLLNKQQNLVEGLVEEDSQFMQLGKKCVRKSSDTSSMEPPLRLFSEDSLSKDAFKKVHKGSFLNRPVEILNKLATFQDLKNAKGPSKSSRMVFKAASPSVSEAKKAARRRRMNSIENVPPAKRMHTELINEDSNSIFDLFN